MSTSPHLLSFRPVEKGDEPLLLEIYASTRAEEMDMVPDWPEEFKAAFIQQQFNAQHTYYRQQFPNADYQVIMCDDLPAGRLYINYGEKEILILDIAILSSYRNLGYGSHILKEVMKEAESTQRAVHIHVERNNRALHLYQRLGFEIADDSNAIYLMMQWKSTT